MGSPASMLTSLQVNESVDQRVIIRHVSWAAYEAVRAMRGESAAVRLSYWEGTLELMSPSREHEAIKTLLARLIEAYAEELGLELEGYGSWTLKDPNDLAGAEPDECYSIGLAGSVPDIAIEVVWTSGGLDKLAIYERIGIREVWRWERGALTVFVLTPDGYAPAPNSAIMPALDFDLVVAMLDSPSQSAAVRELRRAVRARSRS